MYFGFDGLYASRVVLGVWGAILVIGVAVFVGRCTGLASPWNMIVVMLVSLAAARWTTSSTSPDVILGALAMWYFGLTAKPDILLSRRTQVLAGAVGGLAYLAKSYAFPFFVTHYSFSVLLHYVFRRPNASISQAVKALASGFTAFAVIGGPWVGILSSKYGGFTFSTAAAFNHYVVGPPDVVGKDRYDVLYPAQTVPPGRITVWETPENLSFKDWSPFGSSAFLTHQLEHVKRNCERIIRTIGDFDLFAIVPGFLFLMLPIRLAAHQRERASPYPAAWSLMTVIVYAGGFLPIAFEARYIEAVLWPICCVLVFGVILDARRLLETGEHTRPAVSLVSLLSVICVVSFARYDVCTVKTAVGTVRTALRPARVHRDRYRAYRDCGDKLVATGCAGPVAACEKCWCTGLFVSYHASLPFLGEIGKCASPAGVEKSLGESGAQVFVANSKWDLFENFVRQTKWQAVCTSTTDEDTISVFLAPKKELRARTLPPD
jgi:hypothetical protein